jgi:antiviral helicase SKI2
VVQPNHAVHFICLGSRLRPESAVPCGLPPIHTLTRENIGDQLLDRYLYNLRSVRCNQPILTQQLWGYNNDVTGLLELSATPLTRTVGIERNELTGEHVAFREVDSLPSDAVVTNSTSINRQPGDKANFTYGLTTNYPFFPGGLDPADFGRSL